MTRLSSRSLYWAPRILSIAFIVFLSLFSLDVFGEHLGFWKTLLALAMHLIPCFVLLVALVLAWRWEWIGAVLYALAGLLYVLWVLTRRIPASLQVNWIAIIALPAFVVALLFLLNWIQHRELHAPNA